MAIPVFRYKAVIVISVEAVTAEPIINEVNIPILPASTVATPLLGTLSTDELLLVRIIVLLVLGTEFNCIFAII